MKNCYEDICCYILISVILSTAHFLLFQALKQLPREKIQLATKFGIAGVAFPPSMTVKGTPEYVRSCCEASLKRLDVDYIDLYYQHRVDTTVPIEETVRVSHLHSTGNFNILGALDLHIL